MDKRNFLKSLSIKPSISSIDWGMEYKLRDRSIYFSNGSTILISGSQMDIPIDIYTSNEYPIEEETKRCQ